MVLKFTTTEEIDQWKVGDNTITLKGFIDSVDYRRVTKRDGTPTMLLKFIVNNDNEEENDPRRVRVLAWADEAAKFESQIQTMSVVKIHRARCSGYVKRTSSSLNGSFNAITNLANVELTLLDKSELTFDGKIDCNVNSLNYKKMSIPEAFNSDEGICVQGYVQMTFVIASNENGSYSFGSITDGFWTLSVRVALYSEMESLKEGVHVELKGRMEIDYQNAEARYLLMPNMAHITIIDDELMTSEELEKGVHIPKTIMNSDDQNVDGDLAA